MSTSAKRACDACHRRKVKCDGGLPCRNCSQASLSCTFNTVPQKKGPKGSRAKVISELREAQRQTQLALKLNDQWPIPPSQVRTPGLLTPEMIKECTDFFFEHMYPTMPILRRERLEQPLDSLETDSDAYCLVAAFCAFMIIQPGINVTGEAAGRVAEPTTYSTVNSGAALLEEVLRVRKTYEYIENASQITVTTSFFIFGCYFGLEKHNTAWFYLREATTLAQILGMEDEDAYSTINPLESIVRRRLFWLLFVTERAYALQRHRSLTLQATVGLPTVEEDAREPVDISGFNHLVNLFLPFGDVFIGLWNKIRSDCSPAWLAQLQQKLADAVPKGLKSPESQVADLKTSQQWLRTMVWQLSISNGYLSSSSADSSMTFKYPIEIARDLLAVTGQLSRQSMEVHGIGLIEKLFDVACTLTDVMACVPLDSATFEIGPRDYLMELVNLISTLRGGESRFLPLLLVKINDSLPHLSPSPSLSGTCSLLAEDVMDCQSPIMGSGDAIAAIATTAEWNAYVSAPSILESATAYRTDIKHDYSQ
ncbi:hypothetical protein FGG08_005798 [Glutinoglossum americanum]|uniref:Zn(2)-C6 fungal-type domain-containing protein n=1 Tax=Glutinoglossum americanum TaxID=1670608 RepID=A0A9P8I2X2_9PEZI|nr:hypothetical protein FGG08_005798 [Glutinoglossum americanum]